MWAETGTVKMDRHTCLSENREIFVGVQAPNLDSEQHLQSETGAGAWRDVHSWASSWFCEKKKSKMKYKKE